MKARDKLTHHPVTAAFKAVFSFFSSLKTAIPLLVITIIVTIGISLLPTPDLFRSWWYLGLLGLNGVSLTFITIQHIPLILRKKGRNALIGVVVTHLGILILIVGAIYGGMSGFRYEVRAIEDEMTIVPGLPFVIHLEKLEVEEYPEGTFAPSSQQSALKKKQDSHITLVKNGQPWVSFVAKPGAPGYVDGITVLPALNDIGWTFEVIITDGQGRQKIIPVKPWSPPVFNVGEKPMMVHNLLGEGEFTAQLLTMKDAEVLPVGVITQGHPLEMDGFSISLGDIRRYTSLMIYDRPHAPLLVTGCLAMMLGLIWHFYFRHRERGRKKGTSRGENDTHV